MLTLHAMLKPSRTSFFHLGTGRTRLRLPETCATSRPMPWHWQPMWDTGCWKLTTQETFAVTKSTGLKLVPSYPPRLDSPFPDVQIVIVTADSETSLGPCRHIVRLAYHNESQAWKVWSYFTKLEGVNGFPSASEENRPVGKHNDTLSYASRRLRESEFKDRDPDVLVGEWMVGQAHSSWSRPQWPLSGGVPPVVWPYCPLH